MRVRNWRTTLDARITRCPGCDGWCWDGACACGPSGVSVQVSGRIGTTLGRRLEPSPEGLTEHHHLLTQGGDRL